MKLSYRWDPQVLDMQEDVNGTDTDFQIRLLREHPYTEAMRLVQHHFETNEIYTDVLFYVYREHRYQVIVRKEYYNDFLLELLKHRLLVSLEWK